MTYFAVNRAAVYSKIVIVVATVHSFRGIIYEEESKMGLMTSLLSTEVLIPVISSITATAIDIITKQYKEKEEKDIDLAIKCFVETQEMFAESYDKLYTADDGVLFGQILKIYAKEEGGEQESDKMIADIIESSFGVEATGEMIGVWKKCFNKTIRNERYTSLLSLTDHSNDNPKDVDIFLSYSWTDEKKADEIDEFFSGIGIDIRRDKMTGITHISLCRLCMRTFVFGILGSGMMSFWKPVMIFQKKLSAPSETAVCLPWW